jgi:cytochrome P450
VFANRRIQESKTRELEKETPAQRQAPCDFLSRFQEAHQKDPDFMSQERVLALTVANMFAGSDTTAISYVLPLIDKVVADLWPDSEQSFTI